MIIMSVYMIANAFGTRGVGIGAMDVFVLAIGEMIAWPYIIGALKG